MIDPKTLLPDAVALLKKLEQDILEYHESTDRAEHLQAEYRKARDAHRTAEHYVDWRAAQVTQAAAAWFLTCVFVRFLEDNHLLDEALLAGPAGPRLQHAKDRITVYFREHPQDAERAYLLRVFEELESFPVMAALLDHRHNPLWQIPVSDDGARALLDFFQGVDPETGAIRHDFEDPAWDTRFLGDLYQDLSESVRKRYALLQTPEFVEAFILDYTLDKARNTFGLPGLRMIDPTCGSGHFLLTGFERLFDAWCRREPATNTRHLAQKALDAVHGVDINPYAIVIARFRLALAAMKAAGSTRIADAPDFHFNLAVGDSLLHGRRHEWTGQGHQRDAYDDPIGHVLEVEDKAQLERILGQRYHVVVGNPPYITVKDKALNQAYRDKYVTCHMKYSLGVPFTERFFDLCLPAESNKPAGYVGMITTNSFMKREFGKKLIEDYLPNKHLTHVIDTSGAYIPNHPTPTVILLARNETPQGDSIRAVLGIRGEPGVPDDAGRGKVWQSIVKLLHNAGAQNEFVSVVNQPRQRYSQHPWSIGGGGVSDLKQMIENQPIRLSEKAYAIGVMAVTGEDDVYARVGRGDLSRLGVPSELQKPLVIGDVVRDWSLRCPGSVIYEYSDSGEHLLAAALDRYFWPFRSVLKPAIYFGKTKQERGLHWREYGVVVKDKLKTPLSITFPFVATHNHFVLDRGGKVFKQTAPVVKLRKGSTEADHLALLGLLNSSSACFWGRQVFFPKGGFADGKWEERLEWDATKLRSFPIADDPECSAERLAGSLDRLAQSLANLEPTAVLAARPESPADALDAAEADAEVIWHRMIALQEELDWCVYHLYGLTDEALCHDDEPPPMRLGERPFEILLSRLVKTDVVQTNWFTRHRITQVTEPPSDWPHDYLDLAMKRHDAIQENRWLRLIERPEYKRRWNREPWDRREERALREWLLDDLERRCRSPELVTCAQLAERARHDDYFRQIAERLTGTDTFDVQALVSELVAGEHVPQFASGRYKPGAMAKFRAWQETWDKQRQEDAIDARTALDPGDPRYLDEDGARALKARQVGDIPLPPKYAKGDFRRGEYWTLRGKLDVPKERFFSLPGCEKPGDTTLVIGWAGLDYLQRAQAIAAWYLDRKEKDGWPVEQLMPMLVALEELIPWLKQWHNDVDPSFGERLGDYYDAFLAEELRHFELSRDALSAWEMPATTRTRRRQ